MQILKNILDFYIKSSIHVALAVSCLVGVTSLEFEITLSYYFYGLVFFATILGYNFVKYAKIAGLHQRSLTNSLQAIQTFSFISFLAFTICVFLIDFKTLLGGIALSGLTFFYAVPLLKNKSLRTMAGLKVLIVGSVWAGVTVILPVLESNSNFSTDVWITFMQRLLVVLALMIPFEIRDIQFDEVALGTMPQKWGVKHTKSFGVALLVVLVLLEGFKDVLSPSHISALILTSLLIGIVVGISRKKQSEYFAAFWVESIPILYLILLKLFTHFLL